MHWVYLSPHFDDAVLSCGGLIWMQTQAGDQVEIFTICAGDVPPGPLSSFAQELHERWETGTEAVERRRAEDIAACKYLDAAHQHFEIPDCIYRRADSYGQGDALQADLFLYATEEALSGPLHPGEQGLILKLSTELAQVLPPHAQLVCPLALGTHVDHQLVRAAAERLDRLLWYYTDYPYVMKNLENLGQLRQTGWHSTTFPVSLDGLQAWQEAIAAHRSQISTFWPDLEAMQVDIQTYWGLWGGVLLWRLPS